MTDYLPENDRLTQLEPATGSATLQWDFELTEESALEIWLDRDDILSLLANPGDYTLPAGIGDEDGGTATLANVTLENDGYILLSNLTVTRPNEFNIKGKLPSKHFNEDFDRLYRVNMEQKRDLSRSLKSTPISGDYDALGARLRNASPGLKTGDLVTFEQVAALAALGFVWGGPWEDISVFAANVLTTNVGVLYICTAPHAATAATEPGVGADWETVFDVFPATIAGGDFRADGSKSMTGPLNFGGNNQTNVNLINGRNYSSDGARLDSFSVNLSTFSLPNNTTISDFGKTVAGLADVSALLGLLGLDNDPWLFEAIGKPFPMLDHIPGFSLPPRDKSYRYILLSAGESGSGGYNEGVLTNEVTSGVYPNNLATAVIDYPTSGAHGQVIRLSNSEGRFYRPGILSGATEESQIAAHNHTYQGVGSTNGGTTVSGGAQLSGTGITASSGGNESRPRNEAARYLVRII